MRRGLPAVFLFLCSAAAAQPVARRVEPVQFRSSFYGEGGGGKYNPNAGAGDYLENSPRLETGKGLPASTPQAPQRTVPPPASSRPQRQGPSGQGGFTPVVVNPEAPRRPAPAVETEADRSRYSLWDGLSAPLDVSAEQAKDMTPDQASRLGRQDYDAHILGERRPQASRADSLPAPGMTGAGPGRGGMALVSMPSSRRQSELFVAVDMDFKDGPGELRDAVADLGRTAGFRPDLRFPPTASDEAQRKVSIWGWLPAQRLAAALNVAGVARLSVQDRSSPRTNPTTSATSSVLVGIRLPREAAPGQVLTRVTRQLEGSGFRWRRTIGYQRVPGSDELALVVEADVPVRALGKVMANPDVLKIAPAPPPPSFAPEAPAPVELPSGPVLQRFLLYALGHSPLLFFLTPFLVLLTFDDGLMRLLMVFIPYQ